VLFVIESTITGLSKGLAAGEFSSMEITRFYLDRIKTYNPTLNAFITVLEEKALRQAQHADEVRRKGQAGPLTGIPIAHKDIFCTQGVLTTCASRMLADWVAPYDATVVYKYREAGMVTLGKTNMDEFAMGSSNETSYLGPVKNPWDTGAVPGGSSGGSAAAVAARLVPAATGTDTGGSIRQPAALCGITGLKPTYGRVSRYGMIAFASSLDQAGPMTQTAEDAGLLLQAMAGFDDKDSTCVNQPVDDYLAGINNRLKGSESGCRRNISTAWIPPWQKSSRRPWMSIKVWVRKSLTSVCPMPSCRYLPIMFWRRRSAPPIWPVLMVYVTAIAVKILPAWKICTGVPARKGLVPRSSAVSWSVPMYYRKATKMPSMSKLLSCAG